MRVSAVFYYLITSAIDAPKLMCNTFPFGDTNAGTEITPAFTASSILDLSVPRLTI